MLQFKVFLLEFDIFMEIFRLVTRLSTTVLCHTSKPQKRRRAVTFAKIFQSLLACVMKWNHDSGRGSHNSFVPLLLSLRKQFAHSNTAPYEIKRSQTDDRLNSSAGQVLLQESCNQHVNEGFPRISHKCDR